MKTTAMALALSVGLSGCVTDEMHQREGTLATGAMVGALVGGLLGYNLIGKGDGRWIGAVLLGAAGAAGGYWAADYLTSEDKAAMEKSAHESLTHATTGETVSWKGESGAAEGSFTPTRTYLNDQGQICRDFDITLTHNAESREGSQTACRRENGDWVIS